MTLDQRRVTPRLCYDIHQWLRKTVVSGVVTEERCVYLEGLRGRGDKGALIIQDREEDGNSL